MIIGHEKQWKFLKGQFEHNKLSHAYLFTGAEGIGKKTFAKEFSEFIGCRFPDLKILSIANKKDQIHGDGGEIKVSQVREVQNFLSYKSYNGGYKIVIVDDAHLMNQEAQNCFLKTLEEPKGETILFLITSKPDMLLPTIFSRCQIMKFSKPKDLPENPEKSAKEKELMRDLLPVIGSNFADKFKYVKSIDFEKNDAAEIVQVFQKYLRHLMMVKIGTENSEAQDAIFSKYSILDIKKALTLAEEINNKLIFTNASPKLALEILLMELENH